MQQLFNFNGQQVRTVTINDEPYFVGKDVATILGYSNTRDALSHHVDDEDKGSQNSTPLVDDKIKPSSTNRVFTR